MSACLILAMGAMPALADQGDTVRVSVDSGGNEANGESGHPTISEDGRFVAFSSTASDLVDDDIDDLRDMFVRDRDLGETERVSAEPAVNTFYFDSPSPQISADGRFVAFVSVSDDLVPDDTNGAHDVFVYDRETAQTTRVSVNSSGEEATADNWDPDFGAHSFGVSISADGRFVGFTSNAMNLVPDDTNDVADVFVHDRETGETTRVSEATDGETTGALSFRTALSADGRHVVFRSGAALVDGDTNEEVDIFVHDRETGETSLVSAAPDEQPSDAASVFPTISDNGRFVGFSSGATNLVPGDTNGQFDLFVRDLETEETIRVSVDNAGDQATGGRSDWAELSADGRYVAFWSEAPNLVAGDTNGARDVFVHDRRTGRTSLVSTSSSGVSGNGGSSGPDISADGRYVAFHSSADNLVAGDVNGVADVFVHQLLPDPLQNDEMLFYRDDGLYRYYDIRPDGSIGAPIRSGDDYTTGWSAITAVDLDGDGTDEMFFYRDDGLYRYYDIRPDGSIGAPIRSGDDYTTNWSAITAVDLDGDGADEMFFYRDDGLYRYYDIGPNAGLGAPIRSGDDYTTNWSAITAVDLPD